MTALNILGEESTYSSEVAAYPAATTPPLFNFSLSGNNLRFNWPADHAGWRLIVQTNNLASGFSLNPNTDWMTVAGSAGNQLNQLSHGYNQTRGILPAHLSLNPPR